MPTSETIKSGLDYSEVYLLCHRQAVKHQHKATRAMHWMVSYTLHIAGDHIM